VISAPIKRFKTIDTGNICVSRKDETICYIRKTSLQHWAMLDIPNEFLVPIKGSW
jgi:hypothetical protein